MIWAFARIAHTMTSKLNKKIGWLRAIAPWVHLAYHSVAAGSNPKHTIYASSICIIEIVVKKDENKQKDPDWSIKTF